MWIMISCACAHSCITALFVSLHSDLDPDERKMLKLTRVKWELPKEMREQQRPCYDNGGCSEICVGNRLHKEVICDTKLFILILAKSVLLVRT